MGNCLPGTQRSILPLAPRDSGAHLPAPLPSSGLCWRFSGPGPRTCRQPAAQGTAGGVDPGRPTLTGLDQRGGARREDAGSRSGKALGGGVANVGESPASAPPESWRLGECVALEWGTQRRLKFFPPACAVQGGVSRITELHPQDSVAGGARPGVCKGFMCFPGTQKMGQVGTTCTRP